MTVEALRPCKCGGEAYVHENTYRDIWEVRCRACPTFVWGKTEAEARAEWQRLGQTEARAS